MGLYEYGWLVSWGRGERVGWFGCFVLYLLFGAEVCMYDRLEVGGFL